MGVLSPFASITVELSPPREYKALVGGKILGTGEIGVR